MSQQPTKKSARVLEKEALAQVAEDDISFPDDWHHMFFFPCDSKFSIVKTDGKRWPQGYTNSEKPSLLKGDIVKIKCGPNYDIDADGEFRIQGSSKHLVKVMTQTVILRKGGHNASQIDCDELLNQFTQVAGAETAGGSQQFDKRKRPKTRKEVEIPFENDIN